MHLLLDTHIFLWWLEDNRRLSKKARAYIIDAEEIYISSASIWEMTIKIKLGKLEAEIDKLVQSITMQGFYELPITSKHAALTGQLPSHHRDPFGRMLIAQAISEPLRFLTMDKTLKLYSDLVEIV